MNFVLRMVIAGTLLMTSTFAFAADMPGSKLVKDVDSWLFGDIGLLIAGIVFAIVALLAFTPWSQRVQPWHALMLLFGLVLFFGAPTYMPIVKTWI